MPRAASRQPVAASSRGGDFQSSRQPVSAASTNWVWNSIRTGASSSECTNSSTRAEQPGGAAEAARLAARTITTSDSAFGASSSTAVSPNNVSISFRFVFGQIGNSWKGSTKYLGRAA